MHKIFVPFLLTLLVIGSSLLPLSMDFQNVIAQIDEEEQIRLYAHSEYAVRPYGDKILNTAPPYGFSRSSIINNGISFYLDPALTSDLSVVGTLNCKLWIEASETKIAKLNITLFEVTSEQNRTIASSAVIGVTAKSITRDFVVGIPINYNFTKGSVIQLYVQNIERNVSLTLYWDNQNTPTSITLPARGPAYFRTLLRAVDNKNLPIPGANITIFSNNFRHWMGNTNSKGYTEVILPYVGDETIYEIEVMWRGAIVNSTSANIYEIKNLNLICEVYDLSIRFLNIINQPAENLLVSLFKDSIMISEETPPPDGSVIFRQLPNGKYILNISYNLRILFFSIKNSEVVDLTLKNNETMEIRTYYIPELIMNISLLIALILLSSLIVIKRIQKKARKKIYKAPFNYFDKFVKGGIPKSNAIMIYGAPGSGKTILLEHFVYDSLKERGSCVFITNLDFPSRVKDRMKELGLKAKNSFLNKNLKFIDCYSETAGQKSSEEYSISSLGDLTTIGVKLSSCLNELGKNTDVFMDSLNPLFTLLKSDDILNFIHSTSAKVKGINGRFFFTVSTGIEEEIRSKLESSSDGVIELQIYESEEKYNRRFRIKKLRKEHFDEWIDFSIEDKKGIIFHLKKKPKKD
jgi:KaiC/GvpD/RAD55 family RecA-like ATPase